MEQKIQTPYGSIKIYRNGPQSARSIMVVPGFSESIVHNKTVIDLLAQKGYDTFTFDQPRKNASVDPLKRHVEIIAAVRSTLIHGGTKIHVVSHSLGAVATLAIAKAHPEQFDSLILMQPSGLSEKQSFLKMTRRVSKKIINNHAEVIRRPQEATDAKSIGLGQLMLTQAASSGMLARNPRLAIKEAYLAIQQSIIDDIKTVESLGVKVYVVKAHSDELFATYKVLNYNQVIQLPGSLLSLADRGAQHDTFWLQPEQTAQIVDTLMQQGSP